MLGKIFVADIFSANNSASSRRSQRVSARIRAESTNVRRTFAGRPAEFTGNFFGGRPADPRGTGRSPRGNARFRGGRSSADPIAVEKIPVVLRPVI